MTPLRHRRIAAIAAAIMLVFGMGPAHAQEMEPRAYSPSPVGTNFLVASYLRTTGDISLDPSIPITGVKASINTWYLGYQRNFGLFGQTGSAAIVVPYLQGEVSGRVFTQGTEVSRSGLGDIRLRLAQNLFGSPALSPEQFAEREPTTSLGTSLVIVAPTGDYNPNHLVNIGSNRWSFRPEIGISQPLGPWFADAAVGMWLFTDNHNFFQRQVRSQSSEWVVQGHAGYNFRAGLWLAADISYLSGGQTATQGIAARDAETVWRYGLTLSVPMGDGFSAKFGWATWLAGHNGGTYNTIAITLQYRWFDR